MKRDKRGKKSKILLWDIETSYNLVSTWNVGYKLNISHENIVKERAIICICYKFLGESKIYSLEWNLGDDKQLLIDFIKVLNSADLSIGHNSDRFDLKWLRTRCIYHGIQTFPEYITIDTLKLSKSHFRFNSNRLDYLGKFLLGEGKLDTGGFKLWQQVVEDNNPQAMKKMITYCKKDIILLEKVYNKLNLHTKSRTHLGVLQGKDECTCPNCSSEDIYLSKTRSTAQGVLRRQMQCKDCNKYFVISNTSYKNWKQN